MVEVRIGSRAIGAGEPCLIIAEAGVNHGGDVDIALHLVDAAAEAGADAVKFQTFSAERLVSPHTPKAAYQSAATGAGDQDEMLRALALPEDAYPALLDRCLERNIEFLSSPFSEADADFLNRLGVKAFKMASGELTNLTLLRHVKAYGKPMLVSTGMATLDEISDAVDALSDVKAESGLILLHCISAYPAPVEQVNLRVIPALREMFQVPIGFSDHSLEHEPALGAISLGAVVLERHLTLDRGGSGPDHAMSSTPEDFASYVRSVRRLEAALGHGRRFPTPAEQDVAAAVRKSLFAAIAIEAGKTLENGDLIALRPGTGISPSRITEVIGKRARRSIPSGKMIDLEMLE